MPLPITGGVWPAVVTCWNETTDRPDLDTQAELIDRFCREGLEGMYVLGSTGRGVAISVEDRKAVAKSCVDAAAGRAPVMIHVGATSHRDAVALAEHAASIGADAVSSVPPIYYPADADDLFEHYRLIAQASDLPFYAYHHALISAMPDAADYARRLLALPHVGGVKFTSNDFYGFMRLRAAVGDRLVLFSGADELLCHGALSGTDGAIGTFYNVWGKAAQHARSAFLAGDVNRGATYMQAFAVALAKVNTPRRKIAGFFRVAMKLRYGLDIGHNRSAMDLIDHPWDEREVSEMLATVDAAAGL